MEQTMANNTTIYEIRQYDPSYILYGGGASFVGHIVFFTLISPWLSGVLAPKYSSLPKYTRMDWNGRFNSNVNAVLSIILSAYTLLFETDMATDKIWYDSPKARVACALIVGYMLADTLCMLVWCKLSRRELVGYLFHHASTMSAFYFVSVYGILCWFAMVRLIAEMSTPSVNQRWFFDVLGYSRKKIIVLVNGMAMLLTFLLFRIVAMPIFWYDIWKITGTDEIRKLGHIQHIIYIPGLILDSLNLLWFYKICRGVVKVLTNLKQKPSEKIE